MQNKAFNGGGDAVVYMPNGQCIEHRGAYSGSVTYSVGDVIDVFMSRRWLCTI